jgi:nitroreductase
MTKTSVTHWTAKVLFLATFPSGIALLTTIPCCSDHQDTRNTTMGSSRSLPPPDINSSALLQALKNRKTSREFADKPLENQLLSGLLWAAYGINRADGGRTAPSAHNWQYIDIFLSDSSGLYRYNAKQHSLDLVRTGDIRALTGFQSFAATAPVSLVFVSDERRFPTEISKEDKLLFAAATVGAIVQNVYLYGAANNLNVGVRGDIDRAQLQRVMELVPEQKILLAQSVGHLPVMASIKAGIRSLLSGN